MNDDVRRLVRFATSEPIVTTRSLVSLWVFWPGFVIAHSATAGGDYAGPWDIHSWLGLFTPTIFGSLLSPGHEWIFAFLVLLLGLFVGDIVGFRFTKLIVVRVMFNLAVLVLLTAVNDLICYHDVESLKELINQP